MGTYNGNYGELDNVENMNNHRVDAKYDVFLSRVFYMTPLSLQLYKDPFQNIDLQATPATGAFIARTFYEMDITKKTDLTVDYSLSLGLSSP